MVLECLDTQTDLDRAIDALTGMCADMKRAHDIAGVPDIRRRSPDFTGLAGIIVAQQVSTASARAIWGRVEAGLGAVTPEAVARRDDDTLRGFGLSRPKIRTLRSVIAAIEDGTLDFSNLAMLPTDAVHEAMTAVKGIGPWTADIYLLFCLGRADVWPQGDLALMEAIRMLRDLPEMPQGEDRIAHAEGWRPYRGAAALLLWAYYGEVKRPGTLA